MHGRLKPSSFRRNKIFVETISEWFYMDLFPDKVIITAKPGSIVTKRIKYCIEPENWQKASRLFETMFKEDFKKITCC